MPCTVQSYAVFTDGYAGAGRADEVAFERGVGCDCASASYGGGVNVGAREREGEEDEDCEEACLSQADFHS